MNWNYILFGGAALGLVVFLPLGIILLTMAVLNWLSNDYKPLYKERPPLSLSGFFKEKELYGERINYKYD